MTESKRQRGRGTDRYTDKQIMMMIRRNKDLSTNLEKKIKNKQLISLVPEEQRDVLEFQGERQIGNYKPYKRKWYQRSGMVKVRTFQPHDKKRVILSTFAAASCYEGGNY